MKLWTTGALNIEGKTVPCSCLQLFFLGIHYIKTNVGRAHRKNSLLFSQLTLSLQCPTKALHAPLPCPHTCCRFHQSHNSQLRHRIKFGEEYRFLLSSLPPLPASSSLLGPNTCIFLITLFSNTRSLCFFLSMKGQVPYP